MDKVIIAGAGPVGLVAAAKLVSAGIPVHMLEAGADLGTESRASTFHPPTLDMLDEFGATAPLMAQGLKAPQLQYRLHDGGLIAGFDFTDISDLTAHPYRVQSEQFKLTRILLNGLQSNPSFQIEFGAEVERVENDGSQARVHVTSNGRSSVRTAAWVLGADGARSNVRRSLDIEFEGFTWPDRFLVLSTPYDFKARIPDLVSVNYVADPECWYFLLQIPGLWRVMFPISAEMSDDDALVPAFGQTLLQRIIPQETFEVTHATLYRVHQRVAKTFRLGRVALAGDAAHINNPLGGMGMNGGIHDAISYAGKLIEVIGGRAPESLLDAYDRQRRAVTIEAVQKQTIQNKTDLEAKTPEARAEFRERLLKIKGDPEATRAYLQRVGMIASLRRAAEIA